MRVFDFYISVAEVTAYDDLEGTVISAGDLPGDLDGTVTTSDALDLVVQPRGVTQAVAMELWIDGQMVSQRSLQDELWVERDYDNIVQPWGFATPLTTPAGIFGTPFSCIGPALGKAEVTIVGVYAHDDGSVTRCPLLTGGIVDNAHREAGEGGIFETFSGVDRGGRFDGVKVTKQFPPGHGLPRGRVLREVMSAVGETQTNFTDGGRMDKELQLVDTEPFPTLAEIAEVENRKIVWDSDAYVGNPQVGRVRDDEDIKFTFEERDILRASTVSLDSVANVITLVVANGTKQNTKDACGIVWQTTTTYTYESPYTIRRCAYQQISDGTYTPISPNSASTTPVLVKKVEEKKAYRCDTLIEEITKTWEMARTEVPRHKWEGGDGTDPELQDGWRCLAVYTDDNNGVGGGPAYNELDESLKLVSISHTFYFYIAQTYHSFTAGGLVYLPKWDNVLMYPPAAQIVLYAAGATEQPQYGQAQGSVTFFSRFGHLEGSIKWRGPFGGYPRVPWTEVEPDTDYEIWGNGAGVNTINSSVSIHNWGFIATERENLYPDAYDSLIPWNISCNVFYGDDNNFLIQEDNYEYAWDAPNGDAYYWGENDIRSEQSLSLQLTGSTIKTYSASGDSHSEVTVSTNEVTGFVETVVVNGIPGHLPAIERLDIAPISDTIYQDGEQADIAAPITQRKDTEQISVTVPFDFFLTCHVAREVVVDFPWAENEDELLQMAENLAQESAAMAVSFTLPANFIIREGDAIHLTYRPLGIDHDLRVKSVRWGYTQGQPILTVVNCRLHGF